MVDPEKYYTMKEISVRNCTVAEDFLPKFDIETENYAHDDRPIRLSLVNCAAVASLRVQEILIEWMQTNSIHEMYMEETPCPLKLLQACQSCRQATVVLDPSSTARILDQSSDGFSYDWSQHNHLTHLCFKELLERDLPDVTSFMTQLPCLTHVTLHTLDVSNFHWVHALLPSNQQQQQLSRMPFPLKSLTVDESRFGRLTLSSLELFARVCEELCVLGFDLRTTTEHQALSTVFKDSPVPLRKFMMAHIDFEGDMRSSEWMPFFLQSCQRLECIEWKENDFLLGDYFTQEGFKEFDGKLKVLCQNHLNLTQVSLRDYPTGIPSWCTGIPSWWEACLQRNRLLKRLRQVPSSMDAPMLPQFMGRFAKDPTALNEFLKKSCHGIDFGSMESSK